MPKNKKNSAPNPMAQKPKNFKKSMVSLLKFCKPYATFIIIAIILAIAGTVLSIITPNILGDITDFIQEGLPTMTNLNPVMDMDGIVSACTFLLILAIISIVFQYLQGYIMATVTQKLSKKLRTGISAKINKLPLKYFDSTSYGDILSRVTNDVDRIGDSLYQSVSSLITSITMLIGTIIMMFITNWIMALCAIGASLIGFGITSVIIVKSQKYFIRQQKELGEINGHIEEIYSGHNVVKAYNGEKEAHKTFSKVNKKLYTSAWKSQYLSGLMMPLMNLVGNLGFVVVCVVGGALAFNGTITFGVITSFMIYVRLFTNPLAQIAQGLTSLQATAAASERVFEFLEEEEISDESNKTKRLEKVEGKVEFCNVHFGYEADKIILNNFSSVALPGQKVAIVYPTGAGKTTLVNLLMRFYELNSGEIKIDDVPISEITRENLHSLFGMVLQDTWLFEGSIYENIVYGKEGVEKEDVVKACKAVGLHHFIKTLPHGYDTILDDKSNLSAGQRQLVTIARAMIENAPLLILDEATSSVDTRTEILIQKAMDTLTEGRTSFVIAHRLSTIKNADLILVMKDGDIVESGNHETLLNKNGFYAELYNSQFA